MSDSLLSSKIVIAIYFEFFVLFPYDFFLKNTSLSKVFDFRNHLLSFFQVKFPLFHKQEYRLVLHSKYSPKSLNAETHCID